MKLREGDMFKRVQKIDAQLKVLKQVAKWRDWVEQQPKRLVSNEDIELVCALEELEALG